MSTRGHSTIDRIVSATLEERRERDTALLLSLLPVSSRSLLRSLSSPSLLFFSSCSLSSLSVSLSFFFFLSRLLASSRARSSRISIDFLPRSWTNPARRRALLRRLLSLVPFVDGRCLSVFSIIFTALASARRSAILSERLKQV